MPKKFIVYIFIFLIAASCYKEEFSTDSSLQLDFSTDTVLFDTIFSGIGSTTRNIKIYNKNSENIRIDEIYLAKGSESSYRLNIDGVSVNTKRDIELYSGDSLWIFVEVTIDPDKDDMLEHDSIVFKYNTNVQDVDLVAFGQDVHLLNRTILKSGRLEADKPYLIYDWVFVDSLETLIIDPGVMLYFHRNSYFIVEGSLKAFGRIDNPIIFRGDRLEEEYSDLPGQWKGIWFVNGSFENVMEYTFVRNAQTGIRVDTMVNLTVPTLSMRNCRIENHSFAGLYALGTYTDISNTLIANCGVYCVGLLIGGKHVFSHNTIANEWYSHRNTPALALSNYYSANHNTYFNGILEAEFYNCIVYGDKNTEIVADVYPVAGSAFLSFDYCLVTIDNEDELYQHEIFSNCLFNANPAFISYDDANFNLGADSDARDIGSMDIINERPYLMFDFNGVDRTLNKKPDIGFLEWIESDE